MRSATGAYLRSCRSISRNPVILPIKPEAPEPLLAIPVVLRTFATTAPHLPHLADQRLRCVPKDEDCFFMPRSRSSARRRRSPSIPLARGGIPPALPCGISAAIASSSPEFPPHALNLSAWHGG